MLENKIIKNQFDALIMYIEEFNKFGISHTYKFIQNNEIRMKKEYLFSICGGEFPNCFVNFLSDYQHRTIKDKSDYFKQMQKVSTKTLEKEEQEFGHLLDYIFLSVYNMLINHNYFYKLSNSFANALDKETELFEKYKFYAEINFYFSERTKNNGNIIKISINKNSILHVAFYKSYETIFAKDINLSEDRQSIYNSYSDFLKLLDKYLITVN